MIKTDLEKRLIVMSLHGIVIEQDNGHRYIQCEETSTGYSFHRELKKHGISLNNKIYGGFLDAVAVVNQAWFEMYGIWLENDFDRIDEDEIDDPGDWTSRITEVGKGQGGLY